MELGTRRACGLLLVASILGLLTVLAGACGRGRTTPSPTPSPTPLAQPTARPIPTPVPTPTPLAKGDAWRALNDAIVGVVELAEGGRLDEARTALAQVRLVYAQAFQETALSLDPTIHRNAAQAAMEAQVAVANGDVAGLRLAGLRLLRSAEKVAFVTIQQGLKNERLSQATIWAPAMAARFGQDTKVSEALRLLEEVRLKPAELATLRPRILSGLVGGFMAQAEQSMKEVLEALERGDIAKAREQALDGLLAHSVVEAEVPRGLGEAKADELARTLGALFGDLSGGSRVQAKERVAQALALMAEYRQATGR